MKGIIHLQLVLFLNSYSVNLGSGVYKDCKTRTIGYSLTSKRIESKSGRNIYAHFKKIEDAFYMFHFKIIANIVVRTLTKVNRKC